MLYILITDVKFSSLADSPVSEAEMPKKFSGENSKAVAAKERKNQAATAKKEAQEKAKEDALWEDNDKHNAKKQVVHTTEAIPETKILEEPEGRR